MHDFKVLSDRDHALARSGVYIGSVIEEPISGIINFTYQTKSVVPGLVKCVEEIYQNCIDHHIKTGFKHAQNISVDIRHTVEGAEVTVKDDGLGIPCTQIDGQYIPVIAWTTLRAGSNFDDANRVGAGTNGMGAALVAIFSNQFIGTTDDGTKRVCVACTDNMGRVEHLVSKSRGVTGTQVQFYPDLTRFGLTEFTQDHVDVIKDRLTNLAVMYPTITFSFNGEVIKFKNIKQVAKNFSDDAIAYSDDRVALVFASSGADEEFRCLSYLNGIYIKNGGTHVDYVMSRVVDSIREAIQKKHKIPVLPNQIKQHLLFASWISGFNAPKFDSQVKERLTNTHAEVGTVLGSIDFEKIAKQILNTPSIVDPMIQAILYKKELADKLALQKLQKEQSKTNLRKITKFTDATCRDREDAMLFIVEGDSAKNSVLSARTETVGCYPLKGKMINAMDATTKELMANAEFVDLMAVTGLKIGEPIEKIDLYEVVIDDITYIVGKDDVIIHNGERISACSLI